jgi:hypothetical protein
VTDDPLERLRRLRGARDAEPSPDQSAPRASTPSMTDVLSLPDDLRALLSWLMRRGGATAADAAAQTDGDEATAQGLLDRLVAQGYVRRIDADGAPVYRARVGSRTGPRLPGELWKVLE